MSLTKREEKEAARFRAAIEADKAYGAANGWSAVTLHSAVVITARHFAKGESEPFRREILRIAADVTCIPMEWVPTVDGMLTKAWRPARGEVGWLPYEVTPEAWAKATPILDSAPA